MWCQKKTKKKTVEACFFMAAGEFRGQCKRYLSKFQSETEK